MCGIAGYISYTGFRDSRFSLTENIYHRGPDYQSHIDFNICNAQIQLAHTRLAIIDLKPDSNQPMQKGEVTILFNGEIYNYKELKIQLEVSGYSFETDSDTEVIIQAYRKWGIHFPKYLNGMFAIVLLDCEKEQLFFCRDRVGVKPLYLYEGDGDLIFGSELKTVIAHPKFKKQLNLEGVRSFIELGYLDESISIFKDVRKITPGNLTVFDLKERNFYNSTYWDINEIIEKEINPDYDQAKDEIHDIIIDSIKSRMVADVPLGVFLSGGYDSSLVAAVMQANTKEAINSFTIGFSDGFDESKYAQQVADYLGLKHHFKICSPTDAREMLEIMPYHFDEPFADDSLIPTLVLSQFSKEYVTVALSADGGDELFGGYDYKRVENLWRISKFLNLFKLFKCKNKKNVEGNRIDFFRELVTSENKNIIIFSERLKRKPVDFIDAFFKQTITRIPFESKVYFNDDLTELMYNDFKHYLPSDILVKVDRSTMAFSLEGREPLLDYRLIEKAFKLPIDFKINGSLRKRILKDIVHQYIPKEIMDRPKAGFTPPIYTWLRGPLSDLLDRYLSEEELNKAGIWNVDFVRNQLDRFKSGKLYYVQTIWHVLVFQMWFKKWMS